MTSIAPTNSPSFADTMPGSSDELEVVMREERRQLKASIEELGSAMKEKVDVSAKLRENPLVIVGAGFAAGLVFGMLSGRSRESGRHSLVTAPNDHGSGKPSPTHNGSSGTFGKFAAAVSGMVGMRVADLAEETIRSSLAKSRFFMPDRKERTKDR